MKKLVLVFLFTKTSLILEAQPTIIINSIHQYRLSIDTNMQKKLVDTHVHIWDFERATYDWLKNDTSILNRNYLIEEYDVARNEVRCGKPRCGKESAAERNNDQSFEMEHD